jgi:hypothetical protein
MLLSAILLFAAPALPAAAAMSKGDCCPEAPCLEISGPDKAGHDQGRKVVCPQACAIACQVLVAPEILIVGPAEIGSAPIVPMAPLSPPGRVLAPELPPPR